MNQIKWDERFMQMAVQVASWSKDRSRKVGCVIVGPNREIRSVGYNGFPRGVDDDVESRHKRPAKYSFVTHAEANSCFNAARVGISLEWCTAYVPWFPCAGCAGALVQSGIVELVYGQVPDFNDPQWGEEFKIAFTILEEAEVITRFAPLANGPKY